MAELHNTFESFEYTKKNSFFLQQHTNGIARCEFAINAIMSIGAVAHSIQTDNMNYV